MPVLKIKKNGVWEKLGGSTKLDGGNADTLDNKHASDFLTVERYDNEMGVLTEEVLPQKANAVHNHDDRYYTEQESDIMLQNKSDVNHTHTNVYAPVQHEHNYAPQNHSHSYNNLTDTPDLSSFASSNHNHADTYASLSHNHSGTYAPLSHNHSSYVNQNAFSNVKVGSTTISADTTTDTLTLVAGDNITITPNATSDQITISATANSSESYTHPNSGVVAGTYKSVTVNSQGHVTAGTNPTTLSGYGITDAVTGDDFALYIQSAAEEMLGKADATHTHKYAGSSTAGGSANSVKSKFTLKLNGGTTEGTNLFTYNGSSAKTVNLTPSSIGAAASSHGTHVSFTTTVPKVAGTASAGTSTYVSRSDHVHPAQTSITGNAATATKATQDGNGNVITTTYATKTYVDNSISSIPSAKTLTQLLSEENIILVEGKHYGSTLPTAGTKGRLFLLLD